MVKCHLNGQHGRNEGETNAQMYSIENKTQYSLNDVTTMNNFGTSIRIRQSTRLTLMILRQL